MEDVAERMRAATAEPPPTSIDLDRLVSDELQRVRRLRWATSAGGVAAAVAAVVFAATMLPGQGGEPESPGLPAVDLCAPLMPSPSGPPPPEQSYGTVRPRPTEPVGDAVRRLSAALDDALLTQLPSMRITPVAEPDCERPQFQYHPQYKEFSAGATLTDSKGSGWFYLTLSPTADDSQPACVSTPDHGTCEDRSLPDGGTARVETFPVNGGTQHQVEIHHPDGTTVRLVANNLHYDSPETRPKVTRPEPVLTVDQLIALGSAPELTLYP